MSGNPLNLQPVEITGEETDVWTRDCEDYPFSGQFGKFFLSVEHYYQYQKYISTDPDFAERIRLTMSSQDLKELIQQEKNQHPKSGDWDQLKERVICQGFYFQFTKYYDIRKQCTSLFYDGSEPPFSVDAKYYELLTTTIQRKLLSTTSQKPKKTRKIKHKKNGPQKKGSLYKQDDGSVTFDMVSSDKVCVSVTDEKLVIPMKAIPSSARQVTKNYQHYKKKNPNIVQELSEEEYDDYIDSDCEEYIYHREPVDEFTFEEKHESSIIAFSDELASLIELGFNDTDANYAALLSTEGDLYDAISILSC